MLVFFAASDEFNKISAYIYYMLIYDVAYDKWLLYICAFYLTFG